VTPESPFSPDALVATLRDMQSPSVEDPALTARVQSRLAVSLLGLAPAVTALTPAALGHHITTPPTSLIAPGSTLATRGIRSVILAWLAPVFIAGAVTGLVADRWLLQKRAAVTTVLEQKVGTAPVAVSDSTLPPPIPDAPIVPPKRLPNVVNTAAAVSATSASADLVSTLTAERQLLDAARATLARGEPQAGISSLEQHVKRFPKGTLTEEREALYIRILVAAGNTSAASARAVNFQQRFPNSMFMPVVERSLASISRRNLEDESKP